jgi:predicted alternative tryptophan synthase beta-subunit
MGKKIHVVLVATATLLSGCAFGTRTAHLTYPPEEGDHSTIALAHAQEGQPDRGRIVVLSVTDDRTEKSRIGNVRNTFGMNTADVVTSDDVRGWVEAAMKSELERAGYVVMQEGAPQTEYAVGLQASLVKVYCDVYMTYDGEVSLMLNLQGGNRSPARKLVEGEGGVGLNWAATAKSYGESLALALQNAISKVLTELDAY